MSFKFTRTSQLIVCMCTVYSMHGWAEIYQWVDSEGRQKFSDSPSKEYRASGYAHSIKNGAPTNSTRSKSIQELEEIAKAFKKDRLTREKRRLKESKTRAQKNNKRKKQLAAVKKRKQACQEARNREDLAFRQRSKRKNLEKMRKALANYEAKREIRREKCK